MSISNLCKIEVRDEIKHYVESEGLSHREAARRLAESLTELLGEEVSPGALRVKAIRAEQDGTDRTTDPTPHEDTESEQIQEIKSHGGKRDGAGRPTKPKPRARPIPVEEIVDDSFLRAYRLFVGVVTDAKKSNWSTTSKVAALHYIDSLYDIVNL